MVFILQKLAELLDKWIPGQGGRSILIGLLTVGAHISLFLTGKETAQVASTSIGLGLGVIFAAIHQPPAPPAT